MGFLDGLEEHSVAAVRAAGRARRYPKGSLLFAEGDTAHEVLIVTAGAVKVVVTSANGQEVVLDVLEAGDLLGELSAIDGGARSAMAVALTQTEVLAISHGAFQSLLAEHACLASALLRLLAARLRGAARRQLEFGTKDALGRVCQRLVDLADRYGAPDSAGRTLLSNPLSQQDLAAWAGLSREAVVKGLRALRTLGWVEIAGRRILLVDHPAISQRAQL